MFTFPANNNKSWYISWNQNAAGKIQEHRTILKKKKKYLSLRETKVSLLKSNISLASISGHHIPFSFSYDSVQGLFTPWGIAIAECSRKRNVRILRNHPLVLYYPYTT